MLLKKIPDTLVIISAVLIFFAFLTWIVPAGEFYREEKQGRQVVVPGSYHEVKQAPQGIPELLKAPVKGFEQASIIIAFVLFVGGVFGVIHRTGSIEAALKNLLRFTGQYPQYKRLIIPFLVILFAVTGATFGMSEEVLVFVLITIPLCISLGYDSILGVAIPLAGTAVGFAGAFTNPFTVGIAQSIAEVPLFTGWEYRIFVLVILTAIVIVYLDRYAQKLEQSPLDSPVYNIDVALRQSYAFVSEDENETAKFKFTTQRKVVVGLFISTIILLIVGATLWNWYIHEICALFLGLAVLTAFVYQLGSTQLIDSFLTGAKEMLPACLVIAFSKGIIIIATEGKIIDTILYAVSHALEGFHPVVSGEIMFVVQSLINVIVPSGSGQAALTMPILAPLSDIVGITRQHAVLIFQMGDGINNMIIPTSGVTMGTLAIAKIKYDVWVKWLTPLMLLLIAAAMLMLVPPALFMYYGPR